ncbi:hypothetical protein AAG570_004472 [Ranatra chinensis]|uniref:Replication termination factor 2 n=1 Tax=Ranatra chinensis TaxID=642074 RepID=A0ABD0Y0Y5_9HEMI
MGCDGGTIPKRDELVRTKKKTEMKDKQSDLNFRWRCCNISQAPLIPPIVACGLGRLYNKDAVIMGILDKATMPESAKHIKSLKDVKELNLTSNPAYTQREGKSDSYTDHQTAAYICPVIGLEMNGKFRFCFSWKCGCVVSERAMKELKSNVCHKCQADVEESEIVVLNPEDSDLDLMRTRMESRQARMKAKKRADKQSSTQVATSSGSQEVDNSSNPPDTSKQPSENPDGVKRSGVVGTLQAVCDPKKAKPGNYKIAKDPEASTAYKSLFTSSEKAKNQMKAHWITYNPFYN